MQNMTEEEIAAAIKRAESRKGGDIEISSEEAGKITKAFKEPEFRKLFEDYMEEISDPKHREEYEAYIKQMEGENQVPKGKELLRPTPGFCVKVKKTNNADKVFINVCSSDGVEEAKSTIITENEKTGEMWSIPHFNGPLRMEKDAKGVASSTLDVVYHSLTIKRCDGDERFRQLVVQTSIESVQKTLQKLKKETTLDKRYRILKNVPYKGIVATMVVSKDALKGRSTSTVDSTKSSSGSSSSGSTNTKKNALGSSKASANSAETKTTSIKESVNKVEKELVKEVKKSLPHGVEIPTYQITHRGAFQLTSFQESAGHAKRPKELIIRVKLPKCKSAKGCDLDVSEKKLVLVKEGMYQLYLDLPYSVHGDNGTAKFDKTTKELIITVPVKQPPKLKAKKFTEPKPEEFETKDDSTPQSENSEKVESTTLSGISSNKSSVDHSRWISKENSSTKKDAPKIIPPPEAKLEASTAEILPETKSSTKVDQTAAIDNEIAVEEDTNIITDKKSEEKKYPDRDYKKNPKCESCGGWAVGLVTSDSGLCNHCKRVNQSSSVTIESKKKAVTFNVVDQNKEEDDIVYSYGNDDEELHSKDSAIDTKSELDDASADVMKPEYKYRQSASTMTVLIMCSNIDKSTVKIKYDMTKCDICFACDGGTKTDTYAMLLQLAGEIDTARCRHIISDRNMCVILQKASGSAVVWPSLEVNVDPEVEEKVNADKLEKSILISSGEGPIVGTTAADEGETVDGLNSSEVPRNDIEERKLNHVAKTSEPAKKPAMNFAPVQWQNKDMYELD